MQMRLNSDMAIIALGANLPVDQTAPQATLYSAMDTLDQKMTLLSRSLIYRTPAFPVNNGPDFANACVLVETAFESDQLLQVLHDIENAFGRVRAQRWGARVLDLDLIAHGNRVTPDIATYNHWRLMDADAQMHQTPDQLILPHPRVQDRAFVLGPLRDIAPDWQHPIIGRSVEQMWQDLPQTHSQAITSL
ncbi:MAG: 2-amino-4-hydroxy-6-hydroxymethyldihydropteridine diphosphokinase [Pseudomonadota bacterium]